MTITVKVEVHAGSNIRQAAEAACRIANKLDVLVEFNFNDVLCLCRPGGSPEYLEKQWKEVVSNKEAPLPKIVTNGLRSP